MSYNTVFVLANSQKNSFFKKMVPIGPMHTDKIEEAEKFATRLDAMGCPAFLHAFSLLNVYEYDPMTFKFL